MNANDSTLSSRTRALTEELIALSSVTPDDKGCQRRLAELLAPLGFKTLSGLVWSAVSEAFFARAAAPALLMVLISSVPMAFLLLRENKKRT